MTLKNIVKTLAVMAVSGALALSACAKTDFAKKNTYIDGQFSDVKSGAWYEKEVASAYELGFVEGISEGEFSPNTSVSVAQGITMASRVHAEYNGKTIEKSGTKWYDMYLDYAIENGILRQGQFEDYDRAITRLELALLFHDAMGSDYFKPVNDVDYIPDIPVGAVYTDKLLTLYNAGIVMGSDDYGSFNPNADIKRSECAAIINRVALPQNRLKKTLLPFTSKNAYILCYNPSMSGSKESINSGWIYDNRGGPAKSDNNGVTTVGDISDKYGSAFIREFNLVPCGVVTFEASIATNSDGAYLEFKNAKGQSTYLIKIVDGKWHIYVADKGYVKLCDDKPGASNVRIVVDLDRGKSTTYFSDVNLGTHDLLSDNIMSFHTGVDEKGRGNLTITNVNIVVNYAAYETFELFGTQSVYGWETNGRVSTVGMQLSLAESKSYAKKSFSKISGTLVAETYFIATQNGDFEIKVGDGLVIAGVGGKLCANGKEMYDLTKNMWYRLYAKLDTDKKTADIYLNGRVIGTVSLTTNEPVGYISFYTEKPNFNVDNLSVYNVYEYADYVPEPSAKANMDDYIVGMNICSLWRNGVHYGWACVSAHDEPTPVLGYYDEGLAESADWEIKFMTEHGIDFQAFCWYADVVSGPLKNPSNSQHLHHGYMYAKYSDYMKYCILWEAANASHFNSYQFRNHVIPYWFENYFLDERYMTIDNKLVLPIFGAGQLINPDYFGSYEGVKKEFDYLEEVARSYGFDGVLYFATGSSSDQLAMMGFDASYAYNWGHAGKELQTNKDRILSSAENQNMYTIPCISVGFDSIPWHGLRYGNMEVEDFGKAFEWVKNEYLPKYSTKYDWADRLVWLSTWNEYGEGTYIMPSGLNGFGYLDEVKKAFTNSDMKHEDVVPNLKQKERITHLYPQYARLLRRDGWYYYERTESTADFEPKNKLFINDVEVSSNADYMYLLPPKVVDGKVYFPFNPSTGVHNILGVYFEWRKEAGTLKILGNGRELLFEAGSDRYFVDGVEKNLGYKVELFDNVPMLDFMLLAKDLGYKAEQKNGDVYIFTDRYDEIWKSIAQRKTGSWEFENEYDPEGWTSSHMNLIVEDGIMKMTALGVTGDPITTYKSASFPEDFYTKKYSSLEVKCRYDYKSNAPSLLAFYYITDLDDKYNESKNLRLRLPNFSTDGEWVTLTYDLTKEGNWQMAERLTGLRFDPFNAIEGTMEIDYIRFIEDPDYVYVPKSERPFEIINGDAENDSVLFYSSNASISRTMDRDNENNKVWNVVSHDLPNNYTYFRYTGYFKDGMSYKIDFDIKLIGSTAKENGPTKTSFNANMRYADKGAFNDFDHVVTGANISQISVSDGWKHYTAVYKVNKLDDKDNIGSEFSIYMNPVDGYGFSFHVDNVTVTELGYDYVEGMDEANLNFSWEKAKGKLIFDDEMPDNCYIGGVDEKNFSDGKLLLSASKAGSDVMFGLSGFSYDAEKYRYIAVRFKTEDLTRIENKAKVYFATDKDENLDETKAKALSHKIFKVDEEGYYTAVFDMSTVALWEGTVKHIRFDPADSGGKFTIDKIMLVEA